MSIEILPKRKVLRLSGFDYGGTSAYFVTICTENKLKILSDIVGDGSPLPQLSFYGGIVDKWIKILPQMYPVAIIEAYVIMPNHIHLLLSIKTDGGRGDPSPTLSAIIGRLKYNITKEVNEVSGKVGNKIFQRSFHDHIIRNRYDYDEHLKYIEENPSKWEDDALYVKSAPLKNNI